jgi:hypothetical protein
MFVYLNALRVNSRGRAVTQTAVSGWPGQMAAVLSQSMCDTRICWTDQVSGYVFLRVLEFSVSVSFH